MSNQEEIGIVSFFHVRRGFGRIRTEQYPTGVFAHFSEVKDRAQILIPHEMVHLEVHHSTRGPIAKQISRISPRQVGVVQSASPGEARILGSDGKVYRFRLEDLLVDSNRHSRVARGWQVQFSPFHEDTGLWAVEIVICDTRSVLEQEVKLDAWEVRLQQLTQLALPEPWSDPSTESRFSVLENYLFESFRLLQRENAISYFPDSEHPEVALWNTGLLTSHDEDILVRMEAMPRTTKYKGYLAPAKWRLSGFFPQSDRRIPAQAKELPLATDFLQGRHALPPCARSWTPDLEHLLQRGARLPEDFVKLSHKEQLQRLQGALHHLQKALRRNPRLAIPQWYEDSIQYLLPLSFEDGRGPVAALVLEPQENHYRVQTILQLSWAYQNARLLGPQQDHWLARWRETQPEQLEPVTR